MNPKTRLMALALLLLGACDKNENENSGSTGSNDGSSMTGMTTTQDCSDYEGLITSEEAALTPRAEPSPEILALQMDHGVAERRGERPPVIASQATYERVRDDFSAISEERGLVTPELPIHGYQGMELFATGDVLAAIEEGSYLPIKCPNDLYGVHSKKIVDGYLSLMLYGIYDVDQLIPEYADIPGLDRVEPADINVSNDGGTSISGTIRGEAYYYEIAVRPGPFDTGPDEDYWYCSLPGQAPQEYDPAQGDPCGAG